MLVVIVLFSFDYFEVTREEMVYDMVLKPESEKLIELRARETDELTTYALLDAEKGIYRIPIEQAMSLVAAEAKK